MITEKMKMSKNDELFSEIIKYMTVVILHKMPNESKF